MVNEVINKETLEKVQAVRTAFIGKSSQAVRSGLDAIKKWSGTFEPPVMQPGKDFGNGPSKRTALLKWTNVQILEMDKGVNPPRLDDDVLIRYMTYAPENELPKKTSTFVKSIMKSAEDLWKKKGEKDKDWIDCVGQVTIMERREYPYKISSKPTADGESSGGQEKSGESIGYAFIGIGLDSPEVGDPIGEFRKILLDNTKKSILRPLSQNPIARQHTEWKELYSLDNGSFEQLFSVKLGDNEHYVEV